MIDNLMIYFIIGGLCLGLMIIMLGISLIGVVFLPSCRRRISDKVTSTRKALIWNGIIRSVTISWMSLQMTSGKEIEMMLKNSPYLSQNELEAAYEILAFSVIFLVLITFFLASNRDKLNTPEMEQKYGNLYGDIFVKYSYGAIFF